MDRHRIIRFSTKFERTINVIGILAAFAGGAAQVYANIFLTHIVIILPSYPFSASYDPSVREIDTGFCQLHPIPRGFS